MDESDRPELPPALRAVAYFTILAGIGTALTIIVDLFHNRLNLNFAVLEIPAGFGLLRLSPGWRKFALFMIWAGVLAFGAGTLFVLFAPSITDLSLNGRPLPTGIVDGSRRRSSWRWGSRSGSTGC